jgi:formylglycine-generating enzyme required for sulfatase activity
MKSVRIGLKALMAAGFAGLLMAAPMSAQVSSTLPRPPSAIIVDARTTPASTRAPVLSGGQTPGAFQAFRDCADCPEMVALPGGTFRMGDDSSSVSVEKPARDVRLSAFAAGRFEVTKGEYAAFVSATERPEPRVTGETWCTWRSPGFTQTDRDPVVCVNTTDAEAYAAWLSQRTGQTYRVMTEAQWEYAARGNTSGQWSFGNDESQLGAYAWFYGNSGRRTHAVGGKRANPFGLFDVHGNVWEWTRDCWQNTYSGLAANDPINATSGCSRRVMRGGCWGSAPAGLRSANRVREEPSNRSGIVGFRLSRTL